MRMLIFIMMFCCSAVFASVLDEIAELEAHKIITEEAQTEPLNRPEVSNIPSVPAIKPYALPNGKHINLNDYTLVLFMQAKCPYCQQFDPQLAVLSAQTGFKVFAYTLDGQGDLAYPNAVPAPPDVVQTFFGSGLQVVTPTLFLVNVNTLKTYPLLQGMTDMQDVMSKINTNLMMTIQ
ncbi:type-F conjugative transfer system pilin assembly thiol-disulfide isomerase TrbB [Providencia heimbachae]|uniref:type-F conjugative transfer system pilin assembly thiol-disulfide isomerase TrbB n=1 Tax=Providencia heimbachae TaxID=333962 RepID=UPI002240D43D|nr:type-F conjugative transfer system pilin assembly thiol-disulfide isomerase TrbB [Providencia heimbachae]